MKNTIYWVSTTCETVTNGQRAVRVFKFLADQRKLDEVVGRYVRVYGIPLDMENNIPGYKEYNYFKTYNSKSSHTDLTLLYREATQDEIAVMPKDSFCHPLTVQPATKSSIDLPPPPPAEPIPEKLEGFIKAGVLTKGF